MRSTLDRGKRFKTAKRVLAVKTKELGANPKCWAKKTKLVRSGRKTRSAAEKRIRHNLGRHLREDWHRSQAGATSRNREPETRPEVRTPWLSVGNDSGWWTKSRQWQEQNFTADLAHTARWRIWPAIENRWASRGRRSHALQRQIQSEKKKRALETETERASTAQAKTKTRSRWRISSAQAATKNRGETQIRSVIPTPVGDTHLGTKTEALGQNKNREQCPTADRNQEMKPKTDW
jgi:hypothetical protein